MIKTRAHRRAESKPLDEARYNDDRYKVISDVRLIRTHAHDTGDIGHFTESDFCQTEAASDVISGKGEKGDKMNASTNFGDYWTTKSLEA